MNREPGKALVSGFVAAMGVLFGVWVSFVTWAALTFTPGTLVNIAAAALMLLGVLVISTALDRR